MEYAYTELVIKIPDRIYYGIKKGITVNGSSASQIVLDAVKDGAPLPKGHGRLIEADRLKEVFMRNTGYDYHDLVDIAPTIIEADKEETDADNN